MRLNDLQEAAKHRDLLVEVESLLKDLRTNGSALFNNNLFDDEVFRTMLIDLLTSFLEVVKHRLTRLGVDLSEAGLTPLAPADPVGLQACMEALRVIARGPGSAPEIPCETCGGAGVIFSQAVEPVDLQDPHPDEPPDEPTEAPCLPCVGTGKRVLLAEEIARHALLACSDETA